MPDDVPVEEPPRRLSPAGPNVWESLRGWELLLVVTTLIPVVFALAGDFSAREKAIVAGCLLTTIPLYVFVGRPGIIAEDRRRSVLYVALLIVLFTPAALTIPAISFSLFGLCSMCYLALPAKEATIASILLWTGPAITVADREDPLGSAFNLIVVMTVVVFFSGTMGLWIERITKQSKERAALIEELEASRAEVARLSAERGAQAERERLAGEIHDTLAQGFTSIIMLVRAAQRQPDPDRHLALAVRTAQENLAEARAFLSALAPAPLDDASLVEALRRITERMGDEIGIGARFEACGAARPLATRTDVVLIRALQEGLANVRKHAAARSVRVALEYGERQVRLSVADDGRGFREECVGFGLRTMRGRVEQAGGTLTLTSAPDAGTTLTVEVPA
ncbi:sensor histidine kinase [Nonomuraea sp. NPDC050540]|uniref:sensor histidine kinase n=1 Tax=Nonomuraea sp. NPDC050540 TaxID=3364367 RepID=UPI0037BA2DA5